MLKGKRTIIIGLIIGIIGTIKAIALPDVAADAPTVEGAGAAWDGLQVAFSWGSAAAVWIVRAVTTTAIFKRE